MKILTDCYESSSVKSFLFDEFLKPPLWVISAQFLLKFRTSLTKMMLRRPDSLARQPISFDDRPFRSLARVSNMGRFTPVTTSTFSSSKKDKLRFVGVPPKIS